MLLNISGGSGLGLFEVNEAAEVIHEVAHADANIIFGAVIDEAMGPEVRVTVIAAGFDRWEERPEFGAEIPQPATPTPPAAGEQTIATPDVFATDDDGADDDGLAEPSNLR